MGNSRKFTISLCKIQLRDQIFRHSRPMSLVILINFLSALFVIWSVKDTDKVAWMKFLNKLLYRADKTKEGIRRHPLMIAHLMNGIVRPKQVVRYINYINSFRSFFHKFIALCS